jgi:hypothetical protein
MDSYLKDLIEDIAMEEVPQNKAIPASPRVATPRVFRLGRLNNNPQSPEWGQPQDQDLVLLEDQESKGQDLLADEVVPAEKKVGLTGTYSSRLFGSSTKYFASKIRKQ